MLGLVFRQRLVNFEIVWNWLELQLSEEIVTQINIRIQKATQMQWTTVVNEPRYIIIEFFEFTRIFQIKYFILYCFSLFDT